jgi:hypothetical protein
MAARKKGVSLDEKRKRLLDYFYEKARANRPRASAAERASAGAQKGVFNLKDLEKGASKEKGIGAPRCACLAAPHHPAVAQTVKDVLQGLVDDGLVDTDKIGRNRTAGPRRRAIPQPCRLRKLLLGAAEQGLAIGAHGVPCMPRRVATAMRAA